MSQPCALVTGVSRRQGIGWAVATRLQADGYRIVTAGWRGYDARMPWGADARDGADIRNFEADFTDPDATAQLIPAINGEFGAISILVLCHCESIDSDIYSTTVASFDRHMAVNARATWQLIRDFALQFPGPPATGRIIAMTSDHTVENVPYGASKGAMDRIILAAAVELAERGITANVINPGPTATGWMTPTIEAEVLRRNVQPRVGQPSDVANLVSFLCSPQGQWINRQLLHSDGGLGD